MYNVSCCVHCRIRMGVNGRTMQSSTSSTSFWVFWPACRIRASPSAASNYGRHDGMAFEAERSKKAKDNRLSSNDFMRFSRNEGMEYSSDSML